MTEITKEELEKVVEELDSLAEKEHDAVERGKLIGGRGTETPHWKYELNEQERREAVERRRALEQAADLLKKRFHLKEKEGRERERNKG